MAKSKSDCHHRCDVAFGVIVSLMSAASMGLGIVDVVLTYLNYQKNCTTSICSASNLLFTWIAVGIWASVPVFITGIITVVNGKNPSKSKGCLGAMVFLCAFLFCPALAAISAVEVWMGCSVFYQPPPQLWQGTPLSSGAKSDLVKFFVPAVIGLIGVIEMIMMIGFLIGLCCFGCCGWYGCGGCKGGGCGGCKGCHGSKRHHCCKKKKSSTEKLVKIDNSTPTPNNVYVVPSPPAAIVPYPPPGYTPSPVVRPISYPAAGPVTYPTPRPISYPPAGPVTYPALGPVSYPASGATYYPGTSLRPQPLEQIPTIYKVSAEVDVTCANKIKKEHHEHEEKKAKKKKKKDHKKDKDATPTPAAAPIPDPNAFTTVWNVDNSNLRVYCQPPHQVPRPIPGALMPPGPTHDGAMPPAEYANRQIAYGNLNSTRPFMVPGAGPTYITTRQIYQS